MAIQLIKSKKYTGVYYYELENKDLSYYIVYKEFSKTKRVFIGKKSEGVNEQFCHQKRNEAVNKLRFGDDAPIVKHKMRDGSTIDEVLAHYLENKSVSKRTITNLKHIVLTLKQVTPKSYTEDFTSDSVQKLKNYLRREDKAPKTINNYIVMLNALFNYAIKYKLYKGDNPCKDIDKLPIDNNRERYLELDEVRALKEAIKDNSMLLLFVELSLSTGARLNTITSIAKKDINLKQRTITLSNHKSKNTYTGFISDSLLPLLEKRLKELKTPNDLVIATSSKTIQKHLQPILNSLFNKNLDIKDAKNRVVIHSLRHTFASHLAINGVPIFTIMKLLDHKDIKDTLRYAKLCKDNGLEAVRELW